MRLVLSLAVALLLASCGSDQAALKSPTKERSLSELATEKGWRVGELNKIYFADPSVTTASGMRVAVNVQNARRFEKIIAPSGNEMENVIVIENVTPADVVKAFLDTRASFELVDSNGEAYADFPVALEQSTESGLFILSPAKPVNTYKYVVIGGLDPDRNEGKMFVAFEIGDFEE